MSTIRRQSIISSGVVYFGFLVGLLNTYFFTREGLLFTAPQYGLTNIFVAISTLMMAFSTMAMPSYIFKFHPYYNDNLEPSKNDMLTVALTVNTIGFLLVAAAGWVFKNLVIRKFSANSPEFVNYYEWVFPMGFGLSVYTILESYTWSIKKPIVTSFLKEVQWRLFTTVLIVLFFFKVIPDFDLFIKLYAFTYPGIALALLLYLLFTGKLHLSLQISKVTRRYATKILKLCVFVYSGTIIFFLSQVFDSLVIASVLTDGTTKVGIFGLATMFTAVIQAPQRAIIATSIPHLSRAWKERDLGLLQKIYQRSSINLLVFATGIFLLITLNYTESIITFGLKEEYLLGFSSFVFLGLTRVVDLGTGVNTEILGTSNYWRFQLISGIILLTLMLPLTLLLARQWDIVGTAIAQLVSISIYNGIRIVFLWKKFRLFPFTRHSLYTVLAGLLAAGLTYFGCRNIHGFPGLVVRSLLFIALYGGAVVYLNLSPDLLPVVDTIKRRLGIRKKNSGK